MDEVAESVCQVISQGTAVQSCVAEWHTWVAAQCPSSQKEKFSDSEATTGPICSILKSEKIHLLAENLCQIITQGTAVQQCMAEWHAWVTAQCPNAHREKLLVVETTPEPVCI